MFAINLKMLVENRAVPLWQVTGPWLMQLLLVAKPQGVVGVAAVRLDEVWRCLDRVS